MLSLDNTSRKIWQDWESTARGPGGCTTLTVLAVDTAIQQALVNSDATLAMVASDPDLVGTIRVFGTNVRITIAVRSPWLIILAIDPQPFFVLSDY